MTEPDILADCASRLIKAGVDSAVVIKTISEMRKVWGGDECYVNKVDRQSRDAAIADALTAGLPLEAAAKRAHCSTATIRRRKSAWLK